MDWSNLLTPEAVATYVTALLGLVFGIIGFFISRWFSRKHPKKVLLMRYGEAELLKVAPDVKNEIQIIFKNHPIETLFQTSFEVRNYSDGVLENLYLRMNFDNENVVDVRVEDDFHRGGSASMAPEDSSLFEMTIPYLNSYKLYKDNIKVSVISLRGIIVHGYRGGGPNWIVEYYDFEKLYKEVFDNIDFVSGNPIVLLKFFLRNISAIFKLARM